MKLLALSGNVSRPSRTRLLVEAAAAAVGAMEGWTAEVFDLVDVGPSLGTASDLASASEGHRLIWEAVRNCDALIVGSPVYKASYAGLLKHFFDLMDMDILVGRPVLLLATAKAPQHALMMEHQFRPLFGFFRAVTIPSAIFATDADFVGPDRIGDKLAEKVRVAADELRRYAALRL